MQGEGVACMVCGLSFHLFQPPVVSCSHHVSLLFLTGRMYSLVNRTKDFVVFVDDVACRSNDAGGTLMQDGSVLDVAGMHLVLETR